MVQQVPELRGKIMAGVDWKVLAEQQLDQYFSRDAEQADADLLIKFADMYSGREVETLSEGFKCANCFKQATQRCSRCKTVWYCSRECQAAHYKKEHKLTCKVLAERMLAKTQKTPPSPAGQPEVLLKPAAKQPQREEPQPVKKPLIEEVDSSEFGGKSGSGNTKNELEAGESGQGVEEPRRNGLEELD